MSDRVTKRVRFLTVILLLTALLSLMATSAFAATTSEIKEQNKQLRQQKLGALFETYMDNMNTSNVGSSVNVVLVEYIGKFNSITDEELGFESTTAKINLYFEQGDSYNDVAWIYYTHYDSLDADGKEAADATFALLKQEIDEATSAKALSEKKHTMYTNGGLCARMQVSIYSEKLEDLLKQTDSERVREKVEAAKEALKNCENVELGSPDYDNILADTGVAVEVQRKQDAAIEELDRVFSVLYPDTVLSENELYLKAFKFIDEDSADNYEKINDRLCSSIIGAMDELAKDGGKYEAAFYEQLKAAVSDAKGFAADSGIANILPSLDGYDFKLEKSQTKDDIVDHINSTNRKDDRRLAEIEKEYNAEGGIIDLSPDSATLAHEKNKATRRIDLYEQYADTIDAIRENRGEDADISNVQTHYETNDDLLKTATPENLDERFNLAMAELEIEEFKAIFGDVLEMDVQTVTVEDKPRIEEAVNALNALNDYAKNDSDIILASQQLTDLYKRIAKQEIDDILGSGELRDGYADSLDDMVDALTRDDIGTIIGDTDKILDMAEGAAKVLDRYDEIVADPDYAGFNDAEKAQLKDTAAGACDEIVSGNADVTKIADAAIVELNREQAAARVESKFRERPLDTLPAVKENIEQIKKDALDAIAAESSPEGLEAIADRAVFDIQKEYDVQDMTDRADALKAQINADPNLTDKQKNTLCAKLDAALDTNTKAVRAAKDQATKDNVTASFKKSADDLETEQKTKSDAMNQITDRYNGVKDKINSLPKLSEEEKAKLLEDAEKVYSQACKNIDDSTTLGVDAIKSKTNADFDLTEGKADATNEIQDKKEQADEIIDLLGYISEEQRGAFKDAVAKAAEDAKAAIADATDLAAIEKAKGNANTAIENTKKESAEQNELAKTEQIENAKQQLEDKYRETIEIIDEKTYLSDAEKQALKDNALAALEAAKKKLDSASNTAEINNITEQYIAKFGEQQSEVHAANDQAQKAQSEGAGSSIDAKHKETISRINSLKYLEHDVKEMLRAQAASVLSDAKNDLSDATSTSEIDRINAESLDLFDTIIEEAVKSDLETAKLRISNELTAQKAKIENVINGFKYLNNDKKQSIKDELDATLNAAHTDIAIADDVETVEQIREKTLSGMAAKHDDSLKLEDDACVDLLRPILIALCAVGIAEAVAILLLLRKKRARATALASFIPFGIMSKSLGTLPTTMWVLTIILAAADILMAIFIVYLIIWLKKNKTAREEPEEESDDIDDSFLHSHELEIATEEEPVEEEPVEEEPVEEEPVEEEPVEEEPVEEEPVEEEPEIVVVPEIEDEAEEEGDTDDAEEDDIDEEFFSYDHEYRRVSRVDPVPVRRSRGKRYKKIPKAVVNVDTLEKNFAPNDTVSFEILKQRGIISDSTERVKILGRGEISKPLTVSMNKFSISAINKILAAGGSVVIERPDAKAKDEENGDNE